MVVFNDAMRMWYDLKEGKHSLDYSTLMQNGVKKSLPLIRVGGAKTKRISL
jgi:hypothetical protein